VCGVPISYCQYKLLHNIKYTIVNTKHTIIINDLSKSTKQIFFNVTSTNRQYILGYNLGNN